jgi:hypothetical protein
MHLTLPRRSLPSVVALVTLGLPFLQLEAQQSPPNCATPEYRQFDFWVGDWNVTVGGNQGGTNNVTLEEGGCVVHEHWVGSKGGSTGQSFNFYDRTIKQWHQFWVDNSGNYLHLTGTYANGRLRLTGVAPGPNGKPQQQRLTFFNNADGSVRQLWETSDDAGKSWQVAFDGLYKKKG